MKKYVVVMLWSMAVLGICISGCGGGDSEGGCKPYQQPGVTLSVNPASVPADGSTSITATVMVLDEKCEAYPAGTQVELSLSEQTPAGAGRFSNTQNTISVSLGVGGFANTTIVSTVAGTAKINATVTGTTLTATAVTLTFTGLVQNLCAIEVTSDPVSIVGDGSSTSTITATVLNFSGEPVSNGTQVSFTTTEGTFTDSSDTSTTATTTDGSAQVTLRSDVVVDNVTAGITGSFTCNDSMQTQYSDQASVRFTPGVASDDPFIILAAPKDNVLADGESSLTLTATVYGSDGNEVGAGVSVTFATNLGSFVGANPVQTDANGQAKISFVGGQTGGSATVTASATVESTLVGDELVLRVVQIGYVEYVGADFTKLGVRGSGRNETSMVSFRVRDTEGNALANLSVVFTISQAPGVVLEPYQTKTDADGYARTILMSGIHATTVTVTATAKVGQITLQAVSPAFAVVGAKPNARYLTFACERNNVDGFIWVNATTKCIVMLADRFSNKIGFATEVAFMTEAGHITPSAVTGVDGDKMGLAETSARTGMPMPADVDPLVSALEDSYTVTIGGNVITRNPRDGLVTMIAYTTGEEDFVDVNENGVYDPPALPDFAGEPFVDLGEPFVDVNDNGVHDEEENLFVDVDGDGEYDGPNGVWDENTIIWTPVWMVWTGHLLEAVIEPCDGFAVPYGSSVTFDWSVIDINLNPLNVSADYAVTVEGKGKLAGSQPRLPLSDVDKLGTEIFLFKVADRSTMERCQEFGVDRDIMCYWMPVVSGFSYGVGGSFAVRGADADPENPEPPGAGTITLEVDYQDSSGKQYTTGTMCEGSFGL